MRPNGYCLLVCAANGAIPIHLRFSANCKASVLGHIGRGGNSCALNDNGKPSFSNTCAYRCTCGSSGTRVLGFCRVSRFFSALPLFICACFIQNNGRKYSINSCVRSTWWRSAMVVGRSFFSDLNSLYKPAIPLCSPIKSGVKNCTLGNVSNSGTKRFRVTMVI